MKEEVTKRTLILTTIRKYFPLIALLILTFALTLFYKSNKNNLSNILEKGKSNLVAFYASNLKPLIVRTEISNEDVFNFALFQSLPIDKEKNKVLTLSKETGGNQVFEIKPSSFNPSTRNYNTFVQYLGLTQVQKEQADSILNSYKNDIYSSILMNDKNTYAVNPKISGIQQAILADLVSFAESVSPEKSAKFLPKLFESLNHKELEQLITSSREFPRSNYILITPDTVTQTNFTWNSDSVNQKFKSIGKGKRTSHLKDENFNFTFAPELKGVPSTPMPPEAFSVSFDSNLIKVIVPMVKIGIATRGADSLRMKLDQVAKKLMKLSLSQKSSVPRAKKPAVPELPGLEKQFENQLSIINPYEIVQKTFELLSKQNIKEFEEFGMKMDSLSKLDQGKMKDSIKKKVREEVLKMKKKYDK